MGNLDSGSRVWVTSIQLTFVGLNVLRSWPRASTTSKDLGKTHLPPHLKLGVTDTLASLVRLKKLLQFNRASGIDQRPCIQDMGSSSAFLHRPEMPSITDLNAIWQKAGVDLAAQACRKALKEWGGVLSDITHVVACTTTCYGNPGVDLLVAERLGLGPEVERVHLADVGCAGGLAIMRVAAQMACGATARQRPARILAFACELCTTNARQELAYAETSTSPEDISIAAALFSDGAAAFVLSNEAGLLQDSG